MSIPSEHHKIVQGNHIFPVFALYTVGPVIIESFWAQKRVSTGALEALDEALVVQTKI